MFYIQCYLLCILLSLLFLFFLCTQSWINPIPKRIQAKTIIIVLYLPTKIAKDDKTVAPPTQTANEVSQQQLVPNMKANALPKNDFL